ncbi:hypothetical protein ACI65C_009475 [Semiaphis heraclei]
MLRMGQDDVLPLLKYVTKSYWKSNEPYRAHVLTTSVSLIIFYGLVYTENQFNDYNLQKEHNIYETLFLRDLIEFHSFHSDLIILFVIRKLNKNVSPPPIPCTDTDKTNLATSNSISSKVPLTIDINNTEITKSVSPNDPALPLPKERIERNVKLSEGPCQIRLLSYPKTLFVAINEVKNLRSALQQLRCNSDFYDEAYTTVLKICNEYDIDEPSIKLRKKSKRFDDKIDNEHIFNTKKEEIRVTVLIPMLDSLIYGIDQRFDQDTILLITAVGKMLKLDLNKDDIKLLSSYFNISEEELISEIRLLLSRDLDCVTQLVKQDCMMWLDWFRKNDIEGFFKRELKMPGCAAINCSNSATKGFLMKHFPKDKVRRKFWLVKMKRDNWSPPTILVHFGEDMWEKTREDGSRRMKNDAVPTIFSFTKEKTKRKPTAHRKVTSIINKQV